jgi:hypothetical protein
MTVVMTVMSVVMRMSMAVMSMSECCESDDINEEPKYANNQEFVEALQLVALP